MELRSVVRELAEAQKNSEKRLTKVEKAIQEVTEAQKRTGEEIRLLAKSDVRLREEVGTSLILCGHRTS